MPLSAYGNDDYPQEELPARKSAIKFQTPEGEDYDEEDPDSDREVMKTKKKKRTSLMRRKTFISPSLSYRRSSFDKRRHILKNSRPKLTSFSAARKPIRRNPKNIKKLTEKQTAEEKATTANQRYKCNELSGGNSCAKTRKTTKNPKR